MAIVIDLRSLRKYWYLKGGHLEFLVKVDFGDDEPDLGELIEIAAGIRHRLAGEGENPADVEQWIRTRAGWSAVMVHAHTVDDGLEWLEMFTDTWNAALDGKVIGGPAPTGPTGHDSSPQLTAYLAYTTGDLTAIPRNERAQLWFVEEKITRYIAEQAITWAYTRGGQQYLCREDADWWVQPVDLDYGLALAQAIDRYTFCNVRCCLERPFRQQAVGLWPQGTVIYQTVDPTLDWRHKLEQVRQTLTWTPPHTDLGFVRYGRGGITRWNHPIVPWPHVDEPQVRYNRPLLASFVPDVNGIQLLTDAHLERATDLTDWVIEPLAGGRHLVSARDLEPWYAQPEAHPEVLARARYDFGEMLMTPERIKTYSPWRDGQ